MPDSLDLILVISDAIDSFDWAEHGLARPYEELRDELSAHIMWDVEKMLEGK